MKKPAILSGLNLKNPRQLFDKYKYLLLVMGVGVILLLLPSGGGAEDTAAQAQSVDGLSFSLDAEEAKLEAALSEIAGAGEVRLVLTLKNNGENYYLQDENTSRKVSGDGSSDSSISQESVIISRGSGLQETVITEQRYPEYQGALIVCEGADNDSVRLAITQAVSSLTGLKSDKISVVKMQTK